MITDQIELHSVQLPLFILVAAKSWSEIILPSDTKHWIFPVEVKLFACLTFLNERKNQPGNKRTVYSPNRQYSCDFADKTNGWFAVLQDIFLQWHTIFNSIPLTSEQSIWTQFFGPCSLFPLEFLFYFGISLGVLFSNFDPFCFSKENSILT